MLVAKDAIVSDDLAKKFKPKSDGVWELRLAAPLRNLPKGRLTVSIKDRQGDGSLVVWSRRR